ncbi:MAG: cysteine--tRNA ligase [Spirochaetes bacterium]|nr:cysteine--tRNA ligase [Spirochaetota bacterium]
MKLTFHNSLTRREEEFIPIDPKEVKVYSCGPTVYNPAHIGNFRAYVVSDLLHRTLMLAGYNVKLVMNLTDVDDKTIRGAKAANMPLAEYTAKYKQMFFEDMETLRIKKAFKYPAATDHISEMVDIIKKLRDKGHTYEADGSIYFRIDTFTSYGALANLAENKLIAGKSGRVANDEYEKENAADFALWKGYTPDDGDVFWETELGKGRPGWHIECSAMSSKYLGTHFDIHTGGVDNKFPHHENELAQSECAFGGKFVNYWLHNEHLIVDGEKMSKSKGNFFTLRDLTAKGYDPLAIRYLLLSSHYRKQLNFTIDGITQASKAIERVNDLIFRLKTPSAATGDAAVREKLATARSAFRQHLFNDLNIAGSLGVLFDFIRETNHAFSSIDRLLADEILAFLKEVDSVIGCFTFDAGASLAEDVERLIADRTAARKAKDYKKSDEIRDKLKAMGIEIMDTPAGVTWKKIGG